MKTTERRLKAEAVQMGRVISMLRDGALDLVPHKMQVPYVRKEHKGYYSVIGNDGSGGVSMLNRTSMEILDLCDGRRTIREIVDVMHERYPDASEKQLLQDVLGSFDRFEDIGLVVLSTTRPQKHSFRQSGELSVSSCEAEESLRLATENDYPVISGYLTRIQKSFESNTDETTVCFAYGDMKRSASQVVLRRELFSFEADYFLLSGRHSAKDFPTLSGIAKIEYPMDVMRNGATLTLLYAPKKQLPLIIDGIESIYASYPLRNVPSLRINIPVMTREGLEETARSLDSIGFSLESIQYGEYGPDNSDLAVFVRYFEAGDNRKIEGC